MAQCKRITGSFKGTRGTWTAAGIDYINPVIDAVNNLAEYWPLTLRQVYYQLVSALVIENNVNQYKKLSDMLSKARLDGIIPWEAMEDRSRTIMKSGGWPDLSAFIENEVDSFLVGYRRDLLQSQSVALEIWIEKDALSHICHAVALPYCVPVIVAKGFSSVTFKDQCRNRILRHARNGKQTLILYFGDLDPSGWAMLPAMMKTLQVEMRLGDAVEPSRCALIPEQVFEYDLPRSIDAMKDTDTRTPNFKAMLREIGQPDDLAVELDALPPQTLEQLVRESIEGCLDMEAFEKEQETEAEERAELADFRNDVAQYIEDNRPEQD